VEKRRKILERYGKRFISGLMDLPGHRVTGGADRLVHSAYLFLKFMGFSGAGGR
jgi:hypothetical protein